ncbi:MAG TPA: hypothetical protein VFN48_04880 [Solirubrobacteraceae bacterium]|nr:hypothetical protein [Solirubrobacteraceae bacterium]
MRRILALLPVLALLVLAPARAAASAPTVTLADPANGALITGGQPVFSGSAQSGQGVSGQVVVDVYPGSSASGIPVQVLHATVTGSSYQVSAVGLPDGTYSASAEESDGAGAVGTSGSVTFVVFNGQPQLTLRAPAAPIRTAEPTFTGTALTSPTAATSADLIVYPGTSTDATPVAVLPGSVAADGSFAIQVMPGLAAGRYTAVASQQAGTGATFSPAVTVTIATRVGGLGFSAPAVGGTEPQSGVAFAGSAGSDVGDAAVVGLTLYRGPRARGTPVGHAGAPVSGGSWRLRWPTTLALGLYTVRAIQMTVTGTVTLTRSFRVAAPGQLQGPVRVSARGRLSARLACIAGSGTCAGDVLIVTRQALQAQPGGPVGRLSLMFVHYSVPAAQARVLSVQLTAGQLRALRRAGATRLITTVVYSVGHTLTETSHLTAPLRVR